MKKDEELDLFYKVFDGATWAVQPSESPDVLCVKEGTVILGVEITAFFRDGPDARLHKMSNYINEIIQARRYRHKDDIEVLKPQLIKIHRQEGDERITVYSGEAIARDVLSYEECALRLQSAIDAKASLAASYRAKVPQVDLIIHDASGVCEFGNISNLYQHFFDLIDRRRLFTSGFREIFLLTRLDSELAVIPLKLNAAAGEFFTFEGLVKDWHASNPAASAEDVVTLLFVCLEQIGLGTSPLWIEKGWPNVSLGAYIWSYSPDGKVILDHVEQPAILEDKTLADIASVVSNAGQQVRGAAEALLCQRQAKTIYVPFCFKSPISRGPHPAIQRGSSKLEPPEE